MEACISKPRVDPITPSPKPPLNPKVREAEEKVAAEAAKQQRPPSNASLRRYGALWPATPTR